MRSLAAKHAKPYKYSNDLLRDRLLSPLFAIMRMIFADIFCRIYMKALQSCQCRISI